METPKNSKKKKKKKKPTTRTTKNVSVCELDSK